MSTINEITSVVKEYCGNIVVCQPGPTIVAVSGKKGIVSVNNNEKIKNGRYGFRIDCFVVLCHLEY